MGEKPYSWNTAKCVRYNEDFTGESHPCYWCGIPQPIVLEGVKWCEKCGGFECPGCHKCWCNSPGPEFQALKALRNKYCCNWENFKKGIVDSSDLEAVEILVPGFKKALDYCRERKGFKDVN